MTYQLRNESKKVSNHSNHGIGFLGLLGILFIGLKLTGHISWSWWLVLAPIYAPLALALCIFMILCAIIGVVTVLDHKENKRKIR